MSALFAFLHHIAAFVLFATLVVEFVLIKDALTLKSARKLQVADMIFGISSGTILVVGLLRVFYFEKGAHYYFHSVPFLAKLSLFIAVGLLSIYPTVEFISWGKSLKQGQLPVVGEQKLRTLRKVIHLEMIGIVVLILCAALMARGIGYMG